MRSAALASAILLLGSNAFAQNTPPLPPGKPAGVRQAALHQTENVLLIGMTVAGAAVAAFLVIHAKAPSTGATTSTSP